MVIESVQVSSCFASWDTCICLNRGIQTSRPDRLCLKYFMWASFCWLDCRRNQDGKGSGRSGRGPCACRVRSRLAEVTGAFCLLCYNWTHSPFIAHRQDIHAQALHIMLYIQILASTTELKWEYVVNGQCESWALWWNLFLCMASTLNRPLVIPGDRRDDGIFTRRKETNLGQKWFFHLLPDELWSSASAKWCEIITLTLLIRLSSGFCCRLCNR